MVIGQCEVAGQQEYQNATIWELTTNPTLVTLHFQHQRQDISESEKPKLSPFLNPRFVQSKHMALQAQSSGCELDTILKVYRHIS